MKSKYATAAVFGGHRLVAGYPVLTKIEDQFVPAFVARILSTDDGEVVLFRVDGIVDLTPLEHVKSPEELTPGTWCWRPLGSPLGVKLTHESKEDLP